MDLNREEDEVLMREMMRQQTGRMQQTEWRGGGGLAYGFTEDDLVLEMSSVRLFNERELDSRKLVECLFMLGGDAGEPIEPMTRVIHHAAALYARLLGNSQDVGDVGMKGESWVRAGELWLACLDTALIWELG